MRTLLELAWIPEPDQETPCTVPGANGDFWFDKPTLNDAARLCLTRCNYTKQCLAAAMKAEAGLPGQYRYGVYGGTLPEQRALIDRNAIVA